MDPKGGQKQRPAVGSGEGGVNVQGITTVNSGQDTGFHGGAEVREAESPLLGVTCYF